jgi:lipid-binding SYLF domain-containing protein
MTRLLLLLLAGCAHAPSTAEGRAALLERSASTISMMIARDPSLREVLEQSAGYVVFPRVVEAGLGVGGAGGRGLLYQHGYPIGYATLNSVSAGAVLGGQTYAEIIVVRDPWTLARLKAGTFHFGGTASAVIVKSGLAGSTLFGPSGVAVFVEPEGGAMINLSLSGQRIKLSG